MYILINFINTFRSIDRNNNNKNNDLRYNLISTLAKELKKREHNIYDCSVDSNDKNKITEHG